MIVILERPTVTLNGRVCRWNGRYNRANFKVQRRDYISVNIDDSFANVRVTALGLSDATIVEVGSKVYIGGSQYEGVHTVVGNAVGFFEIDAFPDGPAFATFLNLLQYKYRIAVTNNFFNGTAFFETDNEYNAYINANAVTAPTTVSDFQNQTALITEQNNQFKVYTLTGREEIDGVLGSSVSITGGAGADLFFIAHGALQNTDDKSPNYANYYDFGLSGWRFLKTTDRGRFFSGKEQYLSFIATKDILHRRVVVRYYNSLNIEVFKTDVPYVSENVDRLYRYQVEDITGLGAKRAVATMETSFADNEAQEFIDYANANGFTGQLNHAEISAMIAELDESTLEPEFSSLPYEYEIEENCGKRGFYLRWINSLGGFDNWFFSEFNLETVSAERGQFDRFQAEGKYSGSGLLRSQLIKSADVQVTVSAEDLQEDYIRILNGLFVSPNIELLDEDSGAFFKVVAVSNESEEYTSRFLGNRFEFTFKLQPLVVQNE